MDYPENQNDEDNEDFEDDDEAYNEEEEEEEEELQADEEVDEAEIDAIMHDTPGTTTTEVQEEQEEEQEQANPIQPTVQEEPQVRRSARAAKPVERLEPTMKGQSYLEYCHNLTDQVHPNPIEDTEYTQDKAILIALFMTEMNERCCHRANEFIETYTLAQGIKKFGQRGKDAAFKEMEQLHQRICFRPKLINELTSEERRRAMESLIFLAEKRDGRIKARHCANGST